MAVDGKTWSVAVVGGWALGSFVALDTAAPDALPKNQGSPSMCRAAHSSETSGRNAGGGEGGGVRRGKTALERARVGRRCGMRAKACADARRRIQDRE
jgi:hypothetical protein